MDCMNRREAFRNQCREIARRHWIAENCNADRAKHAASIEVRSIIATILIGVAIRLIANYIMFWWETRTHEPYESQTIGEPDFTEPMPFEPDGS